MLSSVRVFATPWTVARHAPLSMEFSRQESWSGLALPPPGDLPNPKMEQDPPAFPVLAGGLFTAEPPGKPLSCLKGCQATALLLCPILA